MDNTVATKNGIRSAGGRRDQASLYAIDGGRKYVNPSERQRTLAAMANLDPDKALFALVLAWTGARVSEVLALTPASFQLEDGIVAIVTLKRRRHSVREVPIPQPLMMAIDKRFSLRAAQLNLLDASQRLWAWHRVTAWRFIKQIMQESGVKGRQACPRGLRHGFGVGTLQAGVPLNLVQRWLGHAKMSTTAIYTEASGPEERALAAKFWDL